MNRGPALTLAGIAVGLGLAAVVSTCTGPDESRTWAATSALSEQCGSSPASATRVTASTSDDFDLGGALLTPETDDPSAPVVVLRHGASHTLCDWLDWAEETSAETGATVLLLDRRGQGSSPGRRDLSHDPDDVLAALASVGLPGGRPVVTVGSSMGNASALTLLGQLDRAACAYVGISPVPGSGPLDGVAAVRALPAALRPSAATLMWTEQDGNVPALANDVADAFLAAGADVTQVPLPGDEHARAVLDEHPEAATGVRDAITACS